MPKDDVQKFVLLLSVIFFLLSGCAENASKELAQQEAIEIALKIASTSEPEISGSQVAPFNIVAEKMTLEEVANHIKSNQQNTFSENSPDMLVWFVTMEGIWLPANVPDVVQKPYEHLQIAIDAKTGLEIFRNMQP